MSVVQGRERLEQALIRLKDLLEADELDEIVVLWEVDSILRIMEECQRLST